MPFQVLGVEQRSFPDAAATSAAAVTLGISVAQLESWLARFTSATPVRHGIGHQQVLAAEIERHFETSLVAAGLQRAPTSVSPALGERADFAASPDGRPPALLGEIAFRPNFEKDLVKFAIAARRGLLRLGVLVVATRREEINPAYTSMPQFDKVVRVVQEFAPTFPICILGISGRLS